jgi:hypothetical protein
MRFLKLISTVSLTLCAVGTTSALALQQNNAQEAALLAFARDTATIAGGARYCRMDPDDIDSFMSKVEARITMLSRDDYQKVLARLEFKNILTAATAKEPKEGCNKMEQIFKDALNSDQ